MLPHRLLVSNPLLVQGSRERVRSPTSNVRCRQGRGRGEDPSLPRLGAYSAAFSTDAAPGGPWARGQACCCNRISNPWNFPSTKDVSRDGERQDPLPKRSEEGPPELLAGGPMSEV